jgi:hypothetical protein
VSTQALPVQRKTCDYCGERPIAKGATRYCGRCKDAGRRATSATRTRKPCVRCGGPKGDGKPGIRYCPACREVMAPINEQYAAERRRARAAADRDAVVAAGARIRRRSDAPEGQKWCARCQRFLPLTSFAARAKGNRPTATYCIPCERSYNHQHRLKSVFGIDADQYAAMYDAQEGRCAICLRRPRSRRLAVDHNHGTGEIRGLLCSRCNKHVLGHAMESPSLLRRAANYLERPPARTGQPLESLEHFAEQTEHTFADDIDHARHGYVAVDPTGEAVALTFRTFVALAQAAGLAILMDGKRYASEAQMAVDDLALCEEVWHSYQRQMRLAGYGDPISDEETA